MFRREIQMVALRMKVIQIVMLLTVVVPFASKAKVGDWKNYTNMQFVRGIAGSSSTIWAATSGGVFQFSPADSTYQKFTNSEGLTTNDVTAIAVDASGRVWVGQQSGAIDVYAPVSGQWRYISDVQKYSSTTKRINAFYIDGDELYIATAFGITVFSQSNFEFIDTYPNFSTALQPNVTSIVKFQNRVFAATSAGIVVSKPNAINLATPESWNITLPSITTGNSLSIFNGELYCGAKAGLYKFNGSTWDLVMGSLNPIQIMFSTDTAMIVFDSRSLKSFHASGENYIMGAPAPDSAVGGIFTPKGIFFGFNSSGVGTQSADAQLWKMYFPNGPSSNSFYQIAVDNNGVLWSGTGLSRGSGFSSYDGLSWRNYSAANTPLLLSNDAFAIGIGPDNSKWISTWGEGLVVVDNSGRATQRFDYNNAGFIGVVRNQNEGIPSFAVPGRIGVDKNDNIWTTIYVSAASDKVVWKWNARSSESSAWIPYAGPPWGAQGFMTGVVVDDYDTKWFTNYYYGRNPTGLDVELVYFNENKTIPGTDANGWGRITTNDGLSNDRVYSILKDKSGALWVGTGSGITIISDPSDPKNRITQVQLVAVRDQLINCIAEDALGNKWVGTTSRGVLILSPDGTQLLEQYTAENTNGRLVDNNVFTIAFNNKKGRAYLGGEKGLSSLEILPVTAKTSFSTIDLSPNPIYLPLQPDIEGVMIGGLVEESIIKVLTINGKVLREFPAKGGGRDFWDCKDGDGNSVASGIYIIVAHDKGGTQAASAKVAVIRK